MKKLILILVMMWSVAPLFAQPRPPANQVKNDHIKTSSSFVRRGVYNWKVYIDAPRAVLSEIEYVEYTLHPTFKQPVVRGDKQSQFSYKSSGWGEFNIKVKVQYKNRSVQTFSKWLDL